MGKRFKKIISAWLLATVCATSIVAAGYFPQFVDESGSARLRWKTLPINVALSPSLSKIQPNIKLDSDVLGAVRRSLATWENVAGVKFNVIETDKTSVSPAGNAGDGVSLITIAPSAENILMFGEDATEVPAKTRIFYNRKGIITEADIVLNPYMQFSTDETNGTFDLEATLTHEIGHLLGLEHSHLTGSTMQMQQGRNGIYNLPQTATRTLSDSDISSIRALYGANEGNGDCCGALKGKITLAPTVAAGGFHLWLEEAASGKVHAGTLTKPDGTFLLEGLNSGKYKIFVQDSGEKQKNRKQIYSGGVIEEISIEKGKIANLEKQLTLKERAFSLKYIGFNSQLSNIPIPVNSGKYFTIFLGGDDLNPNDVKISSNSPFITVVPNTTFSQNFGDKISVLSFSVSVKPDTPSGEYSLRVQKNSGETEYFVGGLINDVVVNPWIIQGQFLPVNLD